MPKDYSDYFKLRTLRMLHSELAEIPSEITALEAELKALGYNVSSLDTLEIEIQKVESELK